jgi:hypothetical protein
MKVFLNNRLPFFINILAVPLFVILFLQFVFIILLNYIALCLAGLLHLTQFLDLLRVGMMHWRDRNT